MKEDKDALNTVTKAIRADYNDVYAKPSQMTLSGAIICARAALASMSEMDKPTVGRCTTCGIPLTSGNSPLDDRRQCHECIDIDVEADLGPKQFACLDCGDDLGSYDPKVETIQLCSQCYVQHAHEASEAYHTAYACWLPSSCDGSGTPAKERYGATLHMHHEGMLKYYYGHVGTEHGEHRVIMGSDGKPMSPNQYVLYLCKRCWVLRHTGEHAGEARQRGIDNRSPSHDRPDCIIKGADGKLRAIEFKTFSECPVAFKHQLEAYRDEIRKTGKIGKIDKADKD